MSLPFRAPWAVVGLGVVGGAFARAVRAALPKVELIGLEPDAAAREAARRSGLFTKLGSEAAELQNAGLVMVSAPLAAVERIFADIAPHLAPDCVVSDVAGIKAPVESWAARHLGAIAFVGGHPMAGGERGGFAGAAADVLRGAPVALCPPRGDAAAPGCAPLAELWRALGAEPVILSAAAHDAAVAHTSHLPYTAALALVTLLGREPARASLIGRGFLDSTRVAAFAPEIMADVALANPALPAAARDLARELGRLAEMLESDREAFVAYAAAARARRDSLRR